MLTNRPTQHVPQPLLPVQAVYVPVWHFTDCQDGVANGAGPSECTAGVTDPCSEREPGTRRLRREQAPVPCTPAMANDHTLSRELATTHLHWSPRRPADSQQRAALRRGGDGTRSRGLINPSRRMFSTALVRGLSSWCLRVSLNFTSAHQCPACAFGQKTTLMAQRWRSSRGTAPHKKSRQAAQRLAAT